MNDILDLITLNLVIYFIIFVYIAIKLNKIEKDIEKNKGA